MTITGVCRLWTRTHCAEKFPNNTTWPKETSLFYLCVHTRDSTAVNRHTLHCDTQNTAHWHIEQCIGTHSALHWDTQCITLGHTVHCTETHSALHWYTQCTTFWHIVHCTGTQYALHWDTVHCTETQCLDCMVHCDPYIGLWCYLQRNGKFEKPRFKCW